MDSRFYDVIIVGAGPAGSLAAYHLAERGYRVMILEKDFFPRYKPCGGGLTYRTLNLIPFDIESVIDSRIYRFRFSHRFKYEFIRSSKEPLMVCTMRDKFDMLLLNKAKEKGAECIHGVRVTGFTETFDQVLVHTEEIEYAASFVIGADGVNSITAKSFNLNENIKKGIGIESEIRVPEKYTDQFRETVYLDWGTFMEGYAWVFPKRDHLSIGVGGPISLARHLKTYFFRFLESLQVSDVEILSFRTFPIPYRTGFSRVQASRVLVVGDAAGLTDPLTGEGIYYALKSGKIASSVIMEFLEGITNHPYQYRQRLENEISTELLAAFPIKRIFNTVPLLIHHQLRKSDRLWRGFCKVLTGQVNYLDFKERMGKYHLLWKPMIITAKLIESLRKANYKARKF
ncbi:MAG: geranylgeranyl reductase family protein [Bacteroidetes bacterium]|nr:geranylgeranyl reductase family protein [Bacteroidota bacterium]